MKKKKNNLNKYILKAKKRVLVDIVIALILAFILAMCSAYAASLRVSNNELIDNNKELQNQVDILNIKIERKTSISVIINKAINEFGMKYPRKSQVVYLEDLEKSDDSLAETIKRNIYKIKEKK